MSEGKMLDPDTTRGSLCLLGVRLCSSDMPPAPSPLSTESGARSRLSQPGPLSSPVLRSSSPGKSGRAGAVRCPGTNRCQPETPNHDACGPPALRSRDWSFGSRCSHSGSWAQAVLTQPPSVSGSLGQRVSIFCNGSSSNIGGGNYVGWYQLIPGSGLRTIIYGTTGQPSGVPDRFSGSRSGNTATLTITSLQAEDEVDYYCATYDSSSYNGTVLQARGEARQNLLSPRHGPPGAEASLSKQTLEQQLEMDIKSYFISHVLDSVLSTTLHPVTSSSMIKFTLSKVVDMFSDLPERDTQFLVLPLNPSDVSLLQKPQLSDSQNIPEEDEADFICGADHGSGSSFLFPLPACADSAGLPLGISGSISQTPRLHPAHCPCCSAWTVSNSS
ncbi:hypothetical protein CapIbe_014735 [Capra ibex]